MGNIFHPDGGILQNLRVFRHKLPAHDGNITGRCVMIRGIRKAAAILKMRIFHTKPGSPFVHTFHKLLLASRNVFRHGYTGVVSGGNDNTFDHGFHVLCLSFLQINLGTSHGFCISTGSNCVCHFQAAIFYGVKNENQSHDFGDTCRTASRIRIFGKNHRTGLRFHEETAWRFDQSIVLERSIPGGLLCPGVFFCL